MQQINLCNPFVRNKLLPLIGEDFSGIYIGVKPNWLHSVHDLSRSPDRDKV